MVAHIKSQAIRNQRFSANMRQLFEFLCKVLVRAVQDADLRMRGHARVWSREPALLPRGLSHHLRTTGVVVLCCKMLSVKLRKLVSVVKQLWTAFVLHL